MKIQIDENGWLLLERAGGLKNQYCPKQPEDSYCGDWCPLFGEPELKGNIICISLCERNISCKEEDFVDLRFKEFEDLRRRKI